MDLELLILIYYDDSKMLQNENTIPLTSAEQNRDFLYIDDLMRYMTCF